MKHAKILRGQLSLSLFLIVIFFLFIGTTKTLNAQNRLEQLTVTVVDSGFIYLDEPYPSCHATTIVDTGDGMMAAWFGGTYEKHPDVCIYGAFYRDGKWEKPFQIADGVEDKLIRNPCYNPVLFKRENGDIILYYKIGPSPTKWYGAYKISTDNGVTWSNEKRIPNNQLGPIKNKPVTAPDGGILYPTSVEDDLGWRIYMEHSEQDLSNWHRIEIDNNGFDAIQPSVLFYADGRLQLLCRSMNGRIVESWSEDGGKSWSRVEATDLPNNNSGTDAVTLSDGETQLLIYNPLEKGRHKLALAASIDGKTWRQLTLLEDHESGEYSYPAIIQGNDGRIYITYTYKRELAKYVILEVK
ncbi:exo-alpha-sialidase [Parabacteroides sp. OttesenSCG-928-N08]|nr:exo-alpha-sialidase [Parabacteroides sp. OttesenSCG-928-N08]